MTTDVKMVPEVEEEEVSWRLWLFAGGDVDDVDMQRVRRMMTW